MRELGAAAARGPEDGLARARLDLLAVEGEDHGLVSSVAHGRILGSVSIHHAPSGLARSSGKYFKTQSSGLGAAWPRPQIEASRIAADSSSSRPRSQGPLAISFAAFSLPTRQGVHWPQLSSSKKRIRFN